jgi:hypothetical protein
MVGLVILQVTLLTFLAQLELVQLQELLLDLL